MVDCGKTDATPTVIKTPFIKVAVSVESTTDIYTLRIVASEPSNFTAYYDNKDPDAPFVYKRVGGADDGTDTFERVIKLDDLEAIQTDEHTEQKINGELYRSRVYEEEYDNIQAAVSARELLIHDLYVAYNDIAAVFKYTSLLTSDELEIPTKINSTVLGLIEDIKGYQSTNLKLKAAIDARKAELSTLEGFKLRAKILQRDLSIVKLTLAELGTPADVIVMADVFETFKTDLSNIDKMFVYLINQSNYLLTYINTSKEALKTASDEVPNYTAHIKDEVEKIRKAIDTYVLANPTAASDFSPVLITLIPDLTTYVTECESDLVKTLQGVKDSISKINDDIEKLVTTAKTTAPGGLVVKYEDSRDDVSKTADMIQMMLINIAPELASLTELALSMTDIGGRVGAMIGAVTADITDLQTRLNENETAINAAVTAVTKYMPSFTLDSPLFHWSVTIQLPQE